MTEQSSTTPVDEFERRLDAERWLARGAVKRWALKSLISIATIPVTLSASCLVAITLLESAAPSWLSEALGYCVVVVLCIAALIALGTAVCAGVLTYRDWSLLDWRTQAMGVASWLIVSGVCLLVLLAVLA